jgi:tetratricopeptide (TPR) repeat protein
MRAEFPFRSAAVLAQAWSEAGRWIAWGGEPLAAAPPPPSVPHALRPLAHPLRRLAREVREPRRGPRVAERMGTVAAQCAALAAWAEGRGAGRTALAFARLAVLGRLARKGGDHQEAWRWLRWALALARRRGDRDTFARALAGTAAMYDADGQHSRAARYWRLALLHARELGPWEVEEEAHFALALLALRRGDLAGGLDLAGRALDAVSPHDRRVTRLLGETARHLADGWGLFEPALLLAGALLPHHADPAGRLALHALRAHAAAGAGHPGAYEASWSAALALAPSRGVSVDDRGAALLRLARAAARLRQWGRARHAASLARRAALAGRVDDASRLAELLSAGGGRAARLREEFPARAAGDDEREEADRFCLRAVAVLGERARAEWAGTGGARLRGRGREAACAAT